jgi:hypothetical protein
MSISPCLSATSRVAGSGIARTRLDRRGRASSRPASSTSSIPGWNETKRRASADGRLFEAVLADLLDVLPARSTRGGGLRPK